MKPKLVGIGELLWDLLPSGRQLGGAPANFTYHAFALGANACLVSRIGDDALGREAEEQLRARGMSLAIVQRDHTAPTGTVSVTVAPDGQPCFKIHDHVAWDNIAVEPAAETTVADADAVCFGTLAQRSEPSRSSIRALLSAARPTALRILDVNLRQHYYSPNLVRESLALANVLKINDSELMRLAPMFGLEGDSRSQLAQLSQQFNLRLAALTRGPQGSLLYSRGVWSDHSGESSVVVVDTVGAGDAFTAAMTLGLLRDWPLDMVNQRANDLAAYVCSCSGGMPLLPDRFRATFNPTRLSISHSSN